MTERVMHLVRYWVKPKDWHWVKLKHSDFEMVKLKDLPKG